jgi:hypothetical protein
MVSSKFRPGDQASSVEDGDRVDNSYPLSLRPIADKQGSHERLQDTFISIFVPVPG